MTSSIKYLVIGVFSVVAACVAGIWFAYDSTEALDEILPLKKPAVLSKSQASQEKSFNLICEGAVSIPANGFDSPFKTGNQTFVAGIDIDNHTGWYQGSLSISEARKGTATLRGDVVTVNRPALFERYGSMITGEEFTLDRASGAFEQSVTLSDKRRIVLIKAYCGKLTKPPF
jgi:hypothetical protein